MRHHSGGFTLIELLVVIAIIAVLSVVVILALNPAELLRRSRDSNRLSDIATISEAVNLFSRDLAGTSVGAVSTTYISIPDPSATSTAGDQCQGLGLPALPSGWTYQCAASSSYRGITTGWLPVNFTLMSSGAPFSSAPVDPIDQTSSNLYYAYATNGSQYELTSVMESQKEKSQFATSPTLSSYPEVAAAGSNLSLSPLFNPAGLVGYWNFEEGGGSTLLDQSGNGNTATWFGTKAGNNGTYYQSGKVGNYSGFFDGSTDHASTTSGGTLNISGNLTMSAWVKTSKTTLQVIVTGFNDSGPPFSGYGLGVSVNSPGLLSYLDATNVVWKDGPTLIDDGNWHFVAAVASGTVLTLYVDGVQDGATSTIAPPTNYAGARTIGAWVAAGYYFSGSLDEVRIYSRALSQSEVLALYNAEK